MITVAKFLNFFSGKREKRGMKVKEFGVKTADLVSSFGDDSAPLEDMFCLYAKTSENSENYIVGFISKNCITNPGEKRIFSLRPDGSGSIDVHLKNDGTLEIGGNTFTAVRFSPLEQALISHVNALNAELLKIQTGITAAGGAYIPASLSLDLSSAESENIKIQ